ncbi:MAG: multicopper oxidase domain-containing protein [Acidithiobacillales bacterium]
MERTRRIGSWLTALGLGAALLVGAPAATGAQTPQVPLAGSAIPQFVQPLPLLSVAGGTMATEFGNKSLTITMCEFDANVLPPGTPLAAGATGSTRVFGYVLGSTCPATQDTYIGPVLVNERGGGSTDITFVNNLGSTATSQVLAWTYSTDQTLHWADPLNNEKNDCNMAGIPGFETPCAQNYEGPIPGVPHLHGGEVPPELDGGPDAWFTSDGNYFGHGYYSAAASGNSVLFKYPNTQEASPIWFHDHVLGATRLNVYAGLAGAYLIYDPTLDLPAGLDPAGLLNGAGGSVEFTVPIVIQDRMFDTDGQLFFPSDTAAGDLETPNPDHPYWVPEFVGDTIVVNGKAWPYLNVEPKRYRFWFIDGSNARTYEMFLVDPVSKNFGPSIYVIATGGGYLDAPVKIDPAAAKPALNVLRMMPGERYEAIIDFSGFEAGAIGPNGLPYSGNWLLRNNAKTPYPAGETPMGSTVGRIMQFRVGACTSGQCGATDGSYNPAAGGAIRSGDQTIVRLVNPATGTLAAGVTAAKTRQLTLNEVLALPSITTDPVTGTPNTAYPGGPLEILVNNTKWGGTDRSDFTPITVNGITTYYSELPKEGDTEVWEIVNLTADAHPIHLHLVQFQLINRQNYNTNKYPAVYDAAFPGGAYLPGYGPPLNYNTGNSRALGGNPDIAAVGKNGKPLYLQGPAMPPEANEAGWKDTVIVLPGQVTRIAVRWAPTSLPTDTAAADLYFPFDPSGESEHGYVWHCHIIDHEDNEMMRPDVVELNSAAPAPALRPLVKGTDY